MMDGITRLEKVILRPLQIVYFLLGLVFLLNGMWWLVVGSLVGVFYVGIIGSKLHPLQAAHDLAKGPSENPAAELEAELLPLGVKRLLVNHACTKVGILIG